MGFRSSGSELHFWTLQKDVISSARGRKCLWQVQKWSSNNQDELCFCNLWKDVISSLCVEGNAFYGVQKRSSNIRIWALFLHPMGECHLSSTFGRECLPQSVENELKPLGSALCGRHSLPNVEDRIRLGTDDPRENLCDVLIPIWWYKINQI